MSRQLETKASFLRPQGEEWVTNNLTGRHSRYHLHNKKWKNTIFVLKVHLFTRWKDIPKDKLETFQYLKKLTYGFLDEVKN